MSVVGDHLSDELAPILTSTFQEYVDAVAEMFQHIERYATDQGDDWWQGAYSLMLDVDNAPVEALPYLAQFVGVTLPVGADEADMRAAIRAENRQQRGTLAALSAAVQKTLTGTKHMTIHERDTSPYHATVFTRTPETPDVAATLAAIKTVKPAGVVIDLIVTPGETWDEAAATWDAATGTWDDTLTTNI
jgi:hypothetical protein